MRGTELLDPGGVEILTSGTWPALPGRSIETGVIPPSGLRLRTQMALTTITPDEEEQLGQTIEMFEVITQSQPNDFQSLEILKEAYSKLGREGDALSASKRIAKAYLEMGQMSAAIQEYETILQRAPQDPDVQAALKRLESKAGPNGVGDPPPSPPGGFRMAGSSTTVPPLRVDPSGPQDDGAKMMRKYFVDTKLVTQADFNQCWPEANVFTAPSKVQEPFVAMLHDKGIMTVEKALKLISDKSRCAFLSLSTYDLDMDLARTFSAETCRRWCVMPFDRMSKTVLVATANPFNQLAARELGAQTHSRLLWYLTTPADLTKNINKAFR